MKTFMGNFRNVLLSTVILLGLNSLVSSIIVFWLGNIWTQDEPVYRGRGYLTEDIGFIVSVLAAALLFVPLATWVFMRLQKFVTFKHVIAVTLTFAIIYVLYGFFSYNHLIATSGELEELPGDELYNILDWSAVIIAAFVSSLWLLVVRTKKK